MSIFHILHTPGEDRPVHQLDSKLRLRGPKKAPMLNFYYFCASSRGHFIFFVVITRVTFEVHREEEEAAEGKRS